MASLKSLRNEYDVLIAGTDLTGLLVAKAFQRAGRRVALLEATDQIGGTHRPVSTQAGRLPSGLGFIPAKPEAQLLLSWAADLAELNIESQVTDLQPLTFDEGALKAFLGFGERKFHSLDELNYYNHSQQLLFSPSADRWVESLAAQLAPAIHVRKEVTAIQSSAGRVTGFVVNGEELWTAENYVFCPAPHLLVGLLGNDALDGKHRQRLAKATSWTAVHLHFSHAAPVTDNLALHFLVGGGHDFEPMVGRFFASADGRQDSIWMTLISVDRSDDNEFIGHTIRNMKKQIKRPYATALDGLTNEKITVAAEGHGYVSLKSKDVYRFSELGNLWLASHLLSEERGPAGAVAVAHGVCRLAGLEAPTPTPETDLAVEPSSPPPAL